MPDSLTPAPPTTLRAWQRDALDRLADWDDGPFLISAAPGAGKTRPALELAGRLLAARKARRIVVLCPTTPLTRQWAAAAATLGIQLAPDAPGPIAPRDFHGVAVTYARVASDPAGWASKVAPDTLVVVDEAHHLGEDLAWGTSFRHAFARARRWLLLSGTPFRSDATAIPGVSYDRDGLVVADVAYTYADAVTDGICRPVAFVTFDGSLSWRSGDDVIESSFETVLTGREASRRYRTAISTELPDGLPRILKEADAKLRSLRSAEHPHAGGLAVAADATHARQIAKLLHEATGKTPVVVLHTDTNAAKKLAEFRGSRESWIVAVNMVSEGVDIPRLRVGVYATAAKTPLLFRQIVGRFVRTTPGMAPEPSWVYLPADQVLRGHASEVESELRAVLHREDLEGELDELSERRASEPSPTSEFVPLNAEFAAQMTLFGAPAAAEAPPPVPPPPEPDTSRGPVAAFEQRSELRRERTRLVAELHRRDGLGHREINAWLNRATGVTRVDDATIKQLQHSVRLLAKELDRDRRAPARAV